MNKNELCIATISWTRNADEEMELRTSLKELSSLGIPVCITDGGSDEGFIEFMNNLPGFRVFSAKGLWAQAKSSLTEAAKTGAKMVLYTEPDKTEFFSVHLAKMIAGIKASESRGVVMASRSANGFATFPAFQQMTETTINNCCREITGIEADYCYGPFLFNSALLSQLHVLPENIGWGWRPFLFAVAYRLGYSVEVFADDFNCPVAQREDDPKERLYRMKQLAQNIEGLLLAANTPLHRPQRSG